MSKRKYWGLEFQLANSPGKMVAIAATLASLEEGLGYLRVEKQFTVEDSISDRTPMHLRARALNPCGPEQFLYEFSYPLLAPIHVRVELHNFFPVDEISYNNFKNVTHQQFLDRIQNFIFPLLGATDIQKISYGRDRFCVEKILS